MAAPTLLDVIKLNGGDAVVGLIEEATKATPEVRIGTGRTIKGLNYKTNVRTAVPTINFRKVGEGTAVAGSALEQRMVECYVMNPPFEMDKAAAGACEDGPEAYMAMQMVGISMGAFASLGKAFFYGTVATFGLTDAFPGLLQGYDSTNMVVDATGTTDNVSTSVWAVRFGLQDVTWVLGQDGKVEVNDVVEMRLTDGSGNPYDGYYSSLYMRPGLQIGSTRSVGRIHKLTTDTGKGLTDALLDQLLEKFPAGFPPNAIFMSRRSRRQLKNSRTATTPTGAPAPWPDSVDGPEGAIPLITTDSIVNTETLALA